MREEIRILSPTAILGYGFPQSSFDQGMKHKPDVIAVDAGSSDPGPYYLGAGKSFTDAQAVKRDLRIMLKAGIKEKIPVIIGTAGGSGANSHVDWCLEIIRDIAQEEDLHFKMAVIGAEIDQKFLRKQLDQGTISALDPGQPLTEEQLAATTRVVAQMGTEPIINALNNQADVILAGRAYDPAVFAALPMIQGFDPGLALHLGKILECAAIAAIPGSGSDCMFGILRQDSFSIFPLNPERKCTVTSVAAHTLYEKTNPYILPGPGGVLDLKECHFSQENENTVRVTGSRFITAEKYTLKLEGAKVVGYRALSIAGARDPVFISQLDTIIKGVEDRLCDNFKEVDPQSYQLMFHIYGRDGVMGDLEPTPEIKSHEIGIIIEVVADTQEMANTLISFARSTILHYGYTGRIATAGNLAFPYSPSDLQGGPVYEFSVYHLLQVEDPAELFPISWEEI